MVPLLVIILLQRKKEKIEERGVKQAMKRGLIILSSLLLLSSCISNSVSLKPDKTEYSQLVDTPVYIKRAGDTDLETYEIELDQCLIASATETTRSSKIGVGGGISLVGFGTLCCRHSEWDLCAHCHRSRNSRNDCRWFNHNRYAGN